MSVQLVDVLGVIGVLLMHYLFEARVGFYHSTSVNFKIACHVILGSQNLVFGSISDFKAAFIGILVLSSVYNYFCQIMQH